jgi:glycosyltransferase involved in cell wall biosynthesis/GT2 family glycosyltransferase
VIVPVHGAPDHFRRCLASLCRHAVPGGERLVVVLDGAGQSEAETALAAAPDAVVLRRAAARGFAASVEVGIAVSDHDVILLNSDTIVTAGWVGKLRAAAYSSRAIATATPFSNDATLCSLPRGFEANAVPSGHDVDSFAGLVEAVSARAYPRLPAGVGVCLYVKRAALRAVGGFDAGAFGRGYGEEVEFCLRALKAGWLHVLDDATFIYHAGQRSFGPSRARRVRAAERVLSRIHPEYRPTIGRFVREDPLAPLRARVTAQLEARGSPGPRAVAVPARVLHVVHGWPPFNHAGVETYARGLIMRQARRREVAVYARLADPCRSLGDAVELLDQSVRVRLVVNNFTQRDPLSRNALRARGLEADFARLVDSFRPALVHVHHLAGHGAGLLRVLKARRIPYVHHLHDWWTLCARGNLLTPDRALCDGPAPRKCAACLPLTRLPPAGLLNPSLHALRRALLGRGIRNAAALVVGSPFIEASLRTLGLVSQGIPVHLVPYGVEVAGPAPRSRAPAPPVRFGIVGSVMPHKGVHIAVRAFRSVDPEAATLDVWGDTSALPSYVAELHAEASAAVRFRGVFPESEKREVFGDMDVLLAPSLGLESFGLAAREAMACGVPVVASRRGALADAFQAGAQGALVEAGDVEGLRAWIERLAANPATITEWSRRLPAVKGMDENAVEIEEVYRRVLAPSSGA